MVTFLLDSLIKKILTTKRSLAYGLDRTPTEKPEKPHEQFRAPSVAHGNMTF